MPVTRRRFLQASALALAAAPVYLRAAKHKLPIGFSTLGCPGWEWPHILDFAEQHGFATVELRGLKGKMDLPNLPEFAADRLPQIKKDVASHGLRLACLSSSAHMHELDPQKNEEQLADACRFIDLAAALEVPYVRVFGNEIKGDRAQIIDHVAMSLRQLGDYAGPKNVTVIIESHGDFTDSATLKAILDKADSPHAALLWDAHHTFVSGKEEPEFTVGQLGKYIRHTHLKDSVQQGSDIHYVLTGKGTVPVARQVKALVGIGYRGAFSFEWEKVWHPDIEEPEVAIAEYAEVIPSYLKAAHYKAK